MSSPTLGFLGAGHLASYTIAALRRGGHTGQIMLSPRNAAVASRLASDHGCAVAASSQEMIDRADIVVLSVRPHQLEAALDGLEFRPSQIILSAVAGIAVDDLKSHSGMPESVLRFMPSSFIEAGDALYPLFPANEIVEGLLGATGQVLVMESEYQFELATIAACSYAWIYELLDEMTDWFAEAGCPPGIAREMVTRHVRGATTNALAHPEVPLATICSGIATEGTYTKAGLELLRNSGAFTHWNDALTLLRTKLVGGSDDR